MDITITSKRRDGRNQAGGYKHGEVSLRLHCNTRSASPQQLILLSSQLLTAETLRTAKPHDGLISAPSPFVSLANTDDELMTETAEAILMCPPLSSCSMVMGRRTS